MDPLFSGFPDGNELWFRGAAVSDCHSSLSHLLAISCSTKIIVLQPGQLCSCSLPHSLVTSLWGLGISSHLWSALCKTLSSITMNELCSLTCFKFSLISSCPLVKWEYISILPEVSWKFFVGKNFVDVFTLRFWSYRWRSQQASRRPTERRCSFLSPHDLLLPLRCLPQKRSSPPRKDIKQL